MQASNEWGPWRNETHTETVFRTTTGYTPPELQVMTADYANELEAKVRDLTGPFPEPQSNWTKDQWKQLAHLARHRAETAEAKVLRAEGLADALERCATKAHAYLNHSCQVEPYPTDWRECQDPWFKAFVAALSEKGD